MKADSNKRWPRYLSAAVDALLLVSGCIAAGAAGAAGAVPGEFYLRSVEILSIVELCFFALFVVIEVVSAFTISDSTWHTVFVALALLGFHMTGTDFLRVLFEDTPSLMMRIGDILHFFFFECAALAIFFFWNYTYALGFSRRVALLLGLGAAVSLAVYVPLYFFGLSAIGLSLFVLLLIGSLWAIYRRLPLGRQLDRTFIASEALFYALAGSAFTAEGCRLLRFSAVGFSSFHAVPLILVFLSVYAAFAMRADREALKASEYKLQYERIKARALKEQIKPHFIFNTLAAIQSLYRIGTKEGDRALTLLSRHLRTNIEAADTDFIPFERELDNVQVLVDLENMRLSKPVNILYNIDFSDFMVPVLSLQPYIENAIKYSRINEREDGCILVSTRRTGPDVTLVISDNGVGFDPAAVKPSSCGIRNSCERFSMLMGVIPKIESAPGKGTKVTIVIHADGQFPQESEEETSAKEAE